jgi:hypothetical protein
MLKKTNRITNPISILLFFYDFRIKTVARSIQAGALYVLQKKFADHYNDLWFRRANIYISEVLFRQTEKVFLPLYNFMKVIFICYEKLSIAKVNRHYDTKQEIKTSFFLSRHCA